MDISLDFLKNKSISLVGYGVSNKALGGYLLKNGITFSIRDKSVQDLPKGITGFFGEAYIDACEDVIFRSPSIHPSVFNRSKDVFTEISYSLENTVAKKIGITGSDGKTTTSTLIHKILEKEAKAYLVGNVGMPLIHRIDEIKKEDFVVCEMSSFQLYDYTPSLDVAVVTGISPNHLDWHSSMADYIFAKRNILKKSKKAVVNYDSPYKDFFTHSNTSYFSLSDLSFLFEKGVSCAYVKDNCAYYNGQIILPLNKLKLKGEYNILNALAAILATGEFVRRESISEALTSFMGVSHRAETVALVRGITFIDSSIDSTPARTKNTISAFDKSKCILIMGGYDKKLSYNELNEATKGIKCIILLGENREKIYKAVKSSAKKIINVNNIVEAVNASYKEAVAGDYVILSPASASFDMFKNYKERAEKFKEAIRGLENGKDKGNFKYLIK